MSIDHDDAWTRAADCEPRVPVALRAWLAEPGLLSERVNAASDGRAVFRLLQQGPAVLPAGAARRMGVDDTLAHQRLGEFHLYGERWIATQSLFPNSTLARFPWLVDIGGALLGERLKAVGGVTREAFEYLELPTGFPRPDRASDAAATRRIWARRAVHRIDGAPMLVTEIFGLAVPGDC